MILYIILQNAILTTRIINLWEVDMTCAENISQSLQASKQVVQLNIGPIERQPLHSFINKQINSSLFPGEYIDMLFRRVANDLSSYQFLATKRVAFNLVMQMIKQHTNLSVYHCYKLANLYCQAQFGFHMNLSRYLIDALLGEEK